MHLSKYNVVNLKDVFIPKIERNKQQQGQQEFGVCIKFSRKV